MNYPPDRLTEAVKPTARVHRSGSRPAGYLPANGVNVALPRHAEKIVAVIMRASLNARCTTPGFGDVPRGWSAPAVHWYSAVGSAISRKIATK
jgi:hypothetical protein